MWSWRKLALTAGTLLIAAGVATTAAQFPHHPTPRANTAPTLQPAPVASPEPGIDREAPALTANMTPSLPRTWGPTGPQWSRAKKDAETLNLEQAAAQVIVPHWDSPDVAGVTSLMERGGFGGVILMGGAVTTAHALADLTAAVEQADGARPWGTLISTDQEGGTVARLRGIVPDVPGFMAAGAARDKRAVTHAYRESAVDMRALGVTVDYAPVADMTIGMADPIIRTRSAGDDVDNVAATVNAATKGYIDGGVVPVIKHFPGHGSVRVDSHTALPHQSASIAELEQRDLAPFDRAIDAGAPAVMLGHIALAEWDSLPATLAPKAYDYLRRDMGFDGVTFTDALNMGAITRDYSAGEASVAALAAGADVLLMPADPFAARDAIVVAAEGDEVLRDRLYEAATRVIALQYWQRSLGPLVDTGTNYGRDLAVAGTTVAAASCEAPFVSGQVEIVGGNPTTRQRLASALESHGIDAVAVVEPSGDEGTTVVAFAQSEVARSDVDVLISTGSPWLLEGSDARVLVAVYDNSADAVAGLADVLAGAAAPGGVWPVAIDVPYDACE